MGLLNVINESGIDFEAVPLPKKSNVKSNSVELLKKYIKTSSESRLDFFEFTKKYNLKICAILENFNDNFVVSNCIGFDGITIINTLSTRDFWEGTIPTKNQWYRFSSEENTITPFYQFLSFNLKEQIENIYIYFSNTDKILVLCSDKEIILDDDAYLLDDFNHLIKKSFDKEIDNSKLEISVDTIITKYTLDIEKAVKTFLVIHLKDMSLLDYFTDVISRNIWYKINEFFARHYYIFHTSDSKFNFISLSKTNIPDSLFLEHINNNLRPILGDEVKLVTLKNSGRAASYSEIALFLKAE